MKPSELLRKQADMMDMCEGTGATWWQCVKYKNPFGEFIVLNNPILHTEDDVYVFALGIVEDKPVFTGDVLYFNGHKTTAGRTLDFKHEWSWNPPKTTVMVNGIELPKMSYVHSTDVREITLSCEKIDDAQKWYEFLSKL
jgi:hypothetical protein